MIKVLSLLIYRKTEKLDTYDKIATKLDGPLKYLLSLLFFILVTLGVIQVITYLHGILLDYYIYRWTCNDIYSISIFYDFLTFFKRNKYWGFLKTIPW